MEIMDTDKIWNECRERVFELITGITKETDAEQKQRFYNDPVYRLTIVIFTQMLFTIETEDSFIKEKKKLQAEALHHSMKTNFRIRGIEIDD